MLRRAGVLVALTALLVPTVAGAATADAAKRKKKRSPVVTKITPTQAFVGEKLTIRGRYFRRGINKNTVAFRRRGEKVVFVKAEKSTRKLIKVTLPKRLEKMLPVQNGTPVAARLQVRVLSKRFGKRFTKLRKSPRIGPEKPPAPPIPPTAAPGGDCDGDGQLNAVDTDDDNDLLGDDYEKSLKLDPCNADTDGDGVEDGYELASARDLNDDEHQELNTFLPYPAKRPYPNPLDGTDADTDHDGDWLSLGEEYRLWKFVGVRTLARLTYSAGEQFSASDRAGGTGRRVPTLSADNYHRQAEFVGWAGGAGYAGVKLADVSGTFADPSATWWADRGAAYDIRDLDRSRGALTPGEIQYFDNGDGYLDDSERDEDADGLSNWAETSGCMVREYWDKLYDKETRFPLEYKGVDLADPDTDGDGIRDGADDQDNDDVPNIMECSRSGAHGPGAIDPDRSLRPRRAAVNPFNPCLPHPRSRTCPQHVPIGGGVWAPFNPDDELLHIKN